MMPTVGASRVWPVDDRFPRTKLLIQAPREARKWRGVTLWGATLQLKLEAARVTEALRCLKTHMLKHTCVYSMCSYQSHRSNSV